MIDQQAEQIETLVIGGGQAGLSVGYHLSKRGQSFLILDANKEIGDAWRNRWDSLRLFTPARYSSLPGLPFPARGAKFPTKGEMANYLEMYAKRFQLPVRTATKVDRLTKSGERFSVTAGSRCFEAENVVVAMGNYQKPRQPEYSRELNAGIVQLNAHQYRNPSQLQDGSVLVVGVGNSGADIALEVARTHKTWIAGQESGHIPCPIDSFMGRHFLVRVVRFVGHHVLKMSTPMGRKLRPILLVKPAPLIRVKPRDLIGAGIERVPKVTGVKNGQPLLADNRTLDVKNVIWCTGYDPGFSWIDLPIFGEDGRPVHERGIVLSAPGVYFVGLHYLYSMTSDTITGVGRDAERIANVIAAKSRRLRAA